MRLLLDLLQSLPEKYHQRLYQQPATCLAVLSLIHPVQKQLVLRLLYTHQPVKLMDIQKFWFYAQNDDLKDVDLLCRLSIINLDKSLNMVTLDPTFKANLHCALTGSGNNFSFGQLCNKPDQHPVDIEFLDRHASSTWESVLHFLVGTPTEKCPGAVMKLLETSGLMARNSSDELVITQKGFQFLLQDVEMQMWAFLVQYYAVSEEAHMDPVEVLNFLFTLGSLELGQDYDVEPLTETQKHNLRDLSNLGLIYQRKKKSSRFYPTRLATSLITGSMKDAEEQDQGYIIVETNYRIYAYDVSALQIAVLSLFVDLRARFPNMVVGIVTREKVREAFEKGITADQIITYLTNHAHPEMKKNNPVLPMTVRDQFLLWEMERNRLNTTEGHLLHQFVKLEEYNEVLSYSRRVGCLLWTCERKRIIVVSKEGYEGVKQFANRSAKRD